MSLFFFLASSKLIYRHAVSTGLGWVSAAEIDHIGLTRATTLAIERAVENLEYFGQEMIIDGNINYFKQYEKSRCLIKADSLVPAVSAAGIIAKVARDKYMEELSVEFPGYGFENHVGYGTKNHRQALSRLGACKSHRLSYKPISVYGTA